MRKRDLLVRNISMCMNYYKDYKEEYKKLLKRFENTQDTVLDALYNLVMIESRRCKAFTLAGKNSIIAYHGKLFVWGSVLLTFDEDGYHLRERSNPDNCTTRSRNFKDPEVAVRWFVRWYRKPHRSISVY